MKEDLETSKCPTGPSMAAFSSTPRSTNARNAPVSRWPPSAKAELGKCRAKGRGAKSSRYPSMGGREGGRRPLTRPNRNPPRPRISNRRTDEYPIHRMGGSRRQRKILPGTMDIAGSTKTSNRRSARRTRKAKEEEKRTLQEDEARRKRQRGRLEMTADQRPEMQKKRKKDEHREKQK